MPVAPPGGVLLRGLYLSLDPYMRGRMDDRESYAAPVALGAVMIGEAISEVVQSNHPDYAVGNLVMGRTGWATHAASNGDGLQKLDPALKPVSARLGVLGMPGFTAYAGLMLIGKPKPGETVVVAAASGPVGSLVGQLARRAGARAVGIAGGPDKCRYLIEELGFDAAIDHRDPAFAAQLKAACPDGIDVYFENVGGAVWQAVLPLLNTFARVPVCGLIAQYNGEGKNDFSRRHPARGPDQEPDAARVHQFRVRRRALPGLPEDGVRRARRRKYRAPGRRHRGVGKGAPGLHRHAGWPELRQGAGAARCGLRAGRLAPTGSSARGQRVSSTTISKAPGAGTLRPVGDFTMALAAGR